MQNFQIPPRSAVGYLDPEIANEGQKAEGDVNWSPPPAKPCIPDWSEIKSIRKYFNRSGAPQVFPAWLYHESGEERLVKNAAEAVSLGVQYRQATEVEANRYGIGYVWDYGDETNKWRAKPWGLKQFDPRSMVGHGKNFVPATVDHAANQTELLRALALAIAKNEVGKPAEIPDADWQEFQQFIAFKKAQADAAVAQKEPILEDSAGVQPSQLRASTGDDVLGQFARETARNERRTSKP
jgi:hypothetical protein